MPLVRDVIHILGGSDVSILDGLPRSLDPQFLLSRFSLIAAFFMSAIQSLLIGMSPKVKNIPGEYVLTLFMESSNLCSGTNYCHAAKRNRFIIDKRDVAIIHLSSLKGELA